MVVVAADERGDDLRIDDRAALGDAPDRRGERVEVADAVLQEIAAAGAALLEQPHRERRLDVLREDDDADLGVPLADLARGLETFVGERRRHADVDDRDVGHEPADPPDEILAVVDLATTSKSSASRSRTRPSRKSSESSATISRMVIGYAVATMAARAAPDSSCFGMKPLTGECVEAGAVVGRVATRREHHCAGCRACRQGAAATSKPSMPGKLDVEQHDVRAQALSPPDARTRRPGLAGHVESLGAQHQAREAAKARVVVDDQQRPRRCGRHAYSLPILCPVVLSVNPVVVRM